MFLTWLILSPFFLFLFIPVLDWLDLQGVAGKMKKFHARFDSCWNTTLEEHKINGSSGMKKHVDLLSTLISLKDNIDGDGGTVSDTEIKALLLVCLSSYWANY